MEVFYKPVQIIETQSHTSPGIIHNIDKIETHIQSKQNPLFHMTNSYNVNSNQHFLNNQVIQSAQTSAVPGF